MAMPDNTDDSSESDEGAVLSPEELDITDEENVREIGEGRYVISPGSGPPNVREAEATASEPEKKDPDRTDDIDIDEVHDWIATHLESSSSEYAFDVTARFEGRVKQNALHSNNVVATFENLVSWYAQHAGGETPVEDVLGLLLLESNLTVRFPAEALVAFAESHDLESSDSLAALYDTVRNAGGITFNSGR